MKLPLVDLRMPNPGPLAMARLPEPVHASQWKLQWQRAEAGLARPDPLPNGRPAGREDEGRDLEPCGAPVVSSEPAAQAADPVALRPASTEEPLPLKEGAEREAERAPVRLHVQAVPGDGVKVWLGIDGNAALVAQRAGIAVAGLRRTLQSSGERIGAVVCNGVPVDPPAFSSAAPRAPTPSLFLKDSP